MDLAPKIGAGTRQIVLDVLDKAALVEGDIFVLGLSSRVRLSEVISVKFQSGSRTELLIKTILDILEERGIFLAVQGCEHLNRALVVEKSLGWQEGVGDDQCSAYSSCWREWSNCAFQYMKDPVEVEFIVAQGRVGYWRYCYRHACQTCADSYPTDSRGVGELPMSRL